MKPKTKNFFFIAEAKTRWIFWGFEQLSAEIFLRKNMWKLLDF